MKHAIFTILARTAQMGHSHAQTRAVIRHTATRRKHLHDARRIFAYLATTCAALRHLTRAARAPRFTIHN
jgi:hypothetical protein